MGFLDKAKKLAEQAQSKLDEVQKQVNTAPSSDTTRPTGPIVEYDKHGRPIEQQPQDATGGPQGDPLMGGHFAPPPAPPGPVVDPSAPPTVAPAPSFGDPLAGPPPAAAPPVSSAPPVTPGVPPTEPPLSRPAGSPPLRSGPPAAVEAAAPPPAPPGVPATDDDDRDPPSYAPPKLTGGDPLAG